jgi:hypothetical protein
VKADQLVWALPEQQLDSKRATIFLGRRFQRFYCLVSLAHARHSELSAYLMGGIVVCGMPSLLQYHKLIGTGYDLRWKIQFAHFSAFVLRGAVVKRAICVPPSLIRPVWPHANKYIGRILG